jgi:hypothetical protein
MESESRIIGKRYSFGPRGVTILDQYCNQVAARNREEDYTMLKWSEWATKDWRRLHQSGRDV